MTARYNENHSIHPDTSTNAMTCVTEGFNHEKYVEYCDSLSFGDHEVVPLSEEHYNTLKVPTLRKHYKVVRSEAVLVKRSQLIQG